jgi:CheY-like chemotaxis protein
MEGQLPPQYEGIEILCAEDNIVLQRMLAKWFETLKVRVVQVCTPRRLEPKRRWRLPCEGFKTKVFTQVYDGQQAVDRCNEKKFALIFMDLAMPQIDGVEATVTIRCACVGAHRQYVGREH